MYIFMIYMVSRRKVIVLRKVFQENAALIKRLEREAEGKIGSR